MNLAQKRCQYFCYEFSSSIILKIIIIFVIIITVIILIMIFIITEKYIGEFVEKNRTLYIQEVTQGTILSSIMLLGLTIK